MPTADQSRSEEERPSSRTRGRRRLVPIVALAAVVLAAAGAVIAIDRMRADDSAFGSPADSRTEVIPTSTATDVPATETPAPVLTSTPEAPLPDEKLPYKFVNQEVHGNTTLEVTDKLTTRTECIDNVYSGQGKEYTPCDAMQGITLNIEAFPEAATMLNEGILRALYELAWQYQDHDNIPAHQANLLYDELDSPRIRDTKFRELQQRLSLGETFSVPLFGYVNDSFVVEPVSVSLNWKYHVNAIDRPTTMITWHKDARGGLRFEPERGVIRIEQYSTWHGVDHPITNNIYIAQELAVVLSYLPQLVHVKDAREGLTPTLAHPSLEFASTIQRENLFKVLYYFIPEGKPGTYLPDWNDSILHQVR